MRSVIQPKSCKFYGQLRSHNFYSMMQEAASHIRSDFMESNSYNHSVCHVTIDSSDHKLYVRDSITHSERLHKSQQLQSFCVSCDYRYFRSQITC